MIVDALVYAGASLYGGGRTLARAARAMRQRPASTALVAAPAKPVDYDLAGASERLAEECAASAGAPSAWRGSTPGRTTRPPACAALLEHPSVRGLLLHPWEETFSANSERAVALAAQAAARGYPVVVEAGHPLVAEALSLADLARRVDGTVVMTRGGQVNMAGLAQQSADLALEARTEPVRALGRHVPAGLARELRPRTSGPRVCCTARVRRSSISGTSCSARARADGTMTSARPCSAAMRWHCSD